MTERTLTDRELEVLKFLAAGSIQDVIARHLGVTTRSVRRITYSLYAKLGAHTAAEAVSVGYQRGLLGLGPRAGYRLALVPFQQTKTKEVA